VPHRELGVDRLLDALIAGILENATTAVLDGAFYHEISPYVDHDSVEPKSVIDILNAIRHERNHKLLDFGCGVGGHRQALQSLGFHWTGINYRDGMATGAAVVAETDRDILFYDGKTLPFADDHFDVVYSFQTFEHIHHIDLTFAEIWRVLKPGGHLVGQVGYLEQIHDFSTFNFTPYGLKIAALRNGFGLKEIYPKHDVFSFLLRRLLVVSTASNDNSLTHMLDPSGSIHRAFVQWGKTLDLSIERINLMRLMFSANFVFHLEKQEMER